MTAGTRPHQQNQREHMSLNDVRRVQTLLVSAVLTIQAATAVAQRTPFTTSKGEWPSYTGDSRGSRYSPLDQITPSNFSSLEVAWRFKTDSLGPRPEFKLEGT